MKGFREFLSYYKFELFLFTLLLILFNSLFFPNRVFELYLFPVFIMMNIIAGINLISNKSLRLLFSSLFIIALLIFGISIFVPKNPSINFSKFALYFLFYIIITLEIIKQIWQSKKVNKDLIIGVISGYITLGLVGFFIFMAVEMENLGSFGGDSLTDKSLQENSDALLYYSTLL